MNVEMKVDILGLALFSILLTIYSQHSFFIYSFTCVRRRKSHRNRNKNCKTFQGQKTATTKSRQQLRISVGQSYFFSSEYILYDGGNPYHRVDTYRAACNLPS